MRCADLYVGILLLDVRNAKKYEICKLIWDLQFINLLYRRDYHNRIENFYITIGVYRFTRRHSLHSLVSSPLTLSLFYNMPTIKRAAGKWTQLQDKELGELLQSNTVNYKDGTAEYLFEVTQDHFPSFISPGASGRNSAIQRMRGKFLCYEQDLLARGAHGNWLLWNGQWYLIVVYCYWS